MRKTTTPTIKTRTRIPSGTAPSRASGTSSRRTVGSGTRRSIGVMKNTGTMANAKSQRNESAPRITPWRTAASPAPMPAPAETMTSRSIRRFVLESSTVTTETIVEVVESNGLASAKQSTKNQ